MAVNQIDPKLSRAYHAASTEAPAPALDAAILAAARQRLTAPQRRRQPWWSRWMVPASVMATLVLGVSLAFLIEREHPETTDAEPAGRAPATAADTGKEKVGAGATAPAADSGVADQAGAPRARAPVKRQAATAAQLAAPERAEPQAPAVEARQAPVRAPAAQAPALAPGATSATGAPAALPAAAPAPAAKAATQWLLDAPRPPQVWLDEILRLRREGHEQEAARQLAEFRRAYPTYQLPESLSNQ
jgi:hypothetical protein